MERRALLPFLPWMIRATRPPDAPPITLHRALKFAGEAFQGLWFVRAVSATFIEASSSCANFFTRFDPFNPFDSFNPLVAAYAREFLGFFQLESYWDLGFGICRSMGLSLRKCPFKLMN